MIDTAEIFEKDVIIQNLSPAEKEGLIRELYGIISDLMADNAERKKMNVELNESNGRLNEDLWSLYQRFKEIQIATKAGDMERAVEKSVEYVLLHKKLKTQLPREKPNRVSGASAPEPQNQPQTTSPISRGHYAKR